MDETKPLLKELARLGARRAQRKDEDRRRDELLRALYHEHFVDVPELAEMAGLTRARVYQVLGLPRKFRWQGGEWLAADPDR